MIEEVKKEIYSYANPEKAKILQRFFKTGKGQYGEGDVFLGVKVPEQRLIASKYWKFCSLSELQTLLNSEVHEFRLTALLILIKKYLNGEEKEKIYNFYLENISRVNNWDLVDLSSPNIIGNYILENPEKKRVLYELANSKDLWKRRIGILASFALIRNNFFEDALNLSEILLKDTEDLMHKAVGWMLREIGKRKKDELVFFLKKYSKDMPRTMLRYAVEKLSDEEKDFYLKK